MAAYWAQKGHCQHGEGKYLDISAVNVLLRMPKSAQARTLIVPCWSRAFNSRFAIRICGFVLLLLLRVAEALAWEGVLVSVYDGDTVVVAPCGAAEATLLVRLYGIDAPELNQAGGTEARAALLTLVQPRDVVNIVPFYGDQYGRVVGLLIHRGMVLNYEQIRMGQAWFYSQYCKARFCGEWARVEKSARRTRTGIWGADTPVPPWSWRKSNTR